MLKLLYKTYDIVCVKMCYKICYKLKGEMMEIHPAVQGGAEQGSARVGRGQGTSLPNHVFQEVLDAAGSRTRFSSHAKTRIEQRGVRLTADDLTRLDDAIDRMAAKGGCIYNFWNDSTGRGKSLRLKPGSNRIDACYGNDWRTNVYERENHCSKP